MKLRIRTTTGVKPLEVDPTTPLLALKSALSAPQIRIGYPPHPITASDTTPLSALFKDGDLLIIPSQPSTIATPSTLSATPPSTLVVRVVPDDNSCLFRSVNALLSRPNTTSSVTALRAEVAAVVAASPTLYTAAYLGRPNEQYVAWIQSDAAWGGAIELAILSARFAVELAAFDVKTMRLDRYGERSGYATVGFLVYDGIHYNYVAEERKRGKDVTLFDVSDNAVMERARALVQREHDACQFTDTASFALKCGQCGTRMRGEAEALKHAQATGHTQFAENK